MGGPPDTIIPMEIEDILDKLSNDDNEKIRKYIGNLIDSNYSGWESLMGDDL